MSINVMQMPEEGGPEAGEGRLSAQARDAAEAKLAGRQGPAAVLVDSLLGALQYGSKGSRICSGSRQAGRKHEL